MSKWISVEDRLPSAYEVVPTLHDSHIRGYGAIDGNKAWVSYTREYKLRNVTHWFDLPAPPAKNNQSD